MIEETLEEDSGFSFLEDEEIEDAQLQSKSFVGVGFNVVSLDHGSWLVDINGRSVSQCPC